MIYQFKPLELKKEKNLFKRWWNNKHLRKTILYTLGGAVISFGIYYFSEGVNLDHLPSREVWRSLGFGAFFGFFITNSPCARGAC